MDHITFGLLMVVYVVFLILSTLACFWLNAAAAEYFGYSTGTAMLAGCVSMIFILSVFISYINSR